MSHPLVSILINNYNYGRYLADAIDSALNQTYQPLEVIVVDDGSTDDSHRVLAAYDDRVKVIQKANGGQASAFNVGFAASQGEIICFLDADDLFAPRKVEAVVDALCDNELGWCFHPLKLLNLETGERLAAQYRGESGVYDVTQPLRRGKLAGYLPFDGTATSGLCFRRSLLAQILPMPEVIRITSDDYLKYLAWGLTPGYVILEELTTQRLHGNNAYTNRTDKRDLCAKILLLTAYWLRQKTPVMQRFSDNLFAAGIHTYAGFKNVATDDQALVQQYLQQISRRELLWIRLKVLYYGCRERLSVEA